MPQMTVSKSVFHDTQPSLFDEDNGNSIQSSMLIGSGSQKQAFFEDLKEQLAKSEAEDKDKHSTKEAEDRKQHKLMEQEIAKAKDKADALNMLRKA